MTTENRLKQIIKNLTPNQGEISLTSHLKNDLLLDSVALVQIVIRIDLDFGVDLGKSIEDGRKIDTVGDILNCLK